MFVHQILHTNLQIQTFSVTMQNYICECVYVYVCIHALFEVNIFMKSRMCEQVLDTNHAQLKHIC